MQKNHQPNLLLPTDPLAQRLPSFDVCWGSLIFLGSSLIQLTCCSFRSRILVAEVQTRVFFLQGLDMPGQRSWTCQLHTHTHTQICQIPRYISSEVVQKGPWQEWTRTHRCAQWIWSRDKACCRECCIFGSILRPLKTTVAIKRRPVQRDK